MLKRLLKEAARRLGYDLRRPPPPDLDDTFVRLYQSIKGIRGFDQRLFTTYKAVQYLTRSGIAGDFIECGVYQGKQILMMAHSLLACGVTDRPIYLYDTFSGMTRPTPDDFKGDSSTFQATLAKWEASQRGDGSNSYKLASLEAVRETVFASGYPADQFKFVVGDVLQTITGGRHEQIALLRLDNDWYASTRHELELLYESLVVGGVLMIDDYGRWHGARKATDEFFATLGPRAPLLVRTHESERVCIKTVR